MKTGILLAATALSIVMAGPASASVILGLYNTGVHSGGAGWGTGSGIKNGNGADLHWDNNDGNGGHAFTGSPIVSTWLANDGTSQWLTPSPRGDESYDPTTSGTDIYSLTFDLTGFNAASASFAGRFLVDNEVTGITLNGHTITGSGGGFQDWTNFASLTGDFIGGVNTLQFSVLNLAQLTGNPTGLRVEFQQSNVNAVPEPATWGLMLVGFGLIGAAIRRRNVRTTVRFA